METTNPRKLRAELKDYLDLAVNEPVRINRRSGESFILIREDHFAALQDEVYSLQRRLLGMSHAVAGQGKDVEPGLVAERIKTRSRTKKTGGS